MRQQTVLLACLCSAIAMVSAVPLPASNQELDVLQIPLNNGKELDVLTLGTAEQLSDRNKRTIGLLRDLFPDITKQIDDQANRIIAKFLRVLGPTVLRTAIQGNSANRARTNFDADFDDDDDDDDSSSSSNSSSGSSGTRVSIELPTFSPEDSDEDNETVSNQTTTTTSATLSSSAAPDDNQSGEGASIDLEALNKQLEETIRVARQATEAEGVEAEQKLTLTNEVQASSDSSSNKSNNDQQTAESKSPAIDELNLDSNEDAADADDRNKRFLTFGASSPNGGDATGGKGNSGNFLFDIIRLFSGSVQTQTGDEAANAPSSSSSTDESTESNDTDSSRVADGYTEGIPGPVTRLVVLANRGLANLIQDLILRIAATSERLVNFKARLITALI